MSEVYFNAQGKDVTSATTNCPKPETRKPTSNPSVPLPKASQVTSAPHLYLGQPLPKQQQYAVDERRDSPRINIHVGFEAVCLQSFRVLGCRASAFWGRRFRV